MPGGEADRQPHVVVEELIVGHQSSGVLDEIPQHVKGPGCWKNALRGCAITTPDALIDSVEAKRRKLSHHSTAHAAHRPVLAEGTKTQHLSTTLVPPRIRFF